MVSVQKTLLLVGLGNPGTEYSQTRHNIGFMVVDALVKHVAAQWMVDKKHVAEVAQVTMDTHRIICLKPLTYMNESGRAVQSIASFYKIQHNAIIIIQDDIHLELGKTKISNKVSAGGHNGIKSIITHLGPDCIRFRVGIGLDKHPSMLLSDYVLARFSAKEAIIIDSAMPRFLDELKILMQSLL